MANSAKLTADELRLHKVFSSDFKFRIPNYQRPYSWKKEHALQLLDDLGEALDRGTDEPYFLGSIVLIKDDDQLADVIDGQQRLTTLSILFAVLRDMATDDAVKLALDKLLSEPGDVLRGLEASPRLLPRERDAEFFANYVHKPGGTNELVELNDNHVNRDSVRNVRDNASALRNELVKRWNVDNRLALVKFLSTNASMVAVSTPDRDSAYRIFRVMNARGLDLSAADIFKADVIGSLSGTEMEETYADRWDYAQTRLGHDDFGDLFLHIRMIYSKERARESLLREFPKQVLNDYLKQDRGAEFVDEVVVPYSSAYSSIQKMNYESSSNAEEVNLWLRRLNGIGNNDWKPPALWALKNKWDDPVFLVEFLKKLERLAASMMIRRVYATPRVTRYAELLEQLDDKALGLASPAFALQPGEIGDTLQALNSNVYLHSQGRKYILLRLDEALAGTSGVVYDQRIITVEHVLPQNPQRKSQWVKDFSDAERDDWTHKLANLVLLSRAKNSQAQNYEFEKKKTLYFTAKGGVASFAVTTQVLSQPKWNPKTLAARQIELVGVLAREWELQ